MFSAFRKKFIKNHAYYLEPEYLFDAILDRELLLDKENQIQAEKMPADDSELGKNQNKKLAPSFILEDLRIAITMIENFGQIPKVKNEKTGVIEYKLAGKVVPFYTEIDYSDLNPQPVYKGLFTDVQLDSIKLGKRADEKAKLIKDVFTELKQIDFKIEDSENDVLGDAYEYLIENFASGAGKKAGEFYTPQQVSKILARLVIGNKKLLRSIYDPTCGSGSLLLRVAKELKENRTNMQKNEVNVSPSFYGQELNPSTYNYARMNMLLHGTPHQDFHLEQDDTLARPQHLDKKFEAIVANPPFSANWAHNATYHNDERFSAYGKLAPKSKADFAFVQHMLHHLDEQGRMAVVLPHGVLFRGAAEGHIRKFILEQNFLDAVIGLPANIFYGTSIPTCILVFRKDREKNAPILFMDASAHFEKGKNQNNLRDEDVERIISHYQDKKESDKFSYLASLEEIAENDYNLNIPRYVDTFEEEEAVDLEAVALALKNLGAAEKESENKLQAFCQSLNIPTPF